MQRLTCPEPESLAAFLLGKLPDADAETIAAHLDDCTACNQTATSLEALSDSFVLELKRPTGDAQLLGEPDYRRAAQLVAALGAEPTDAGVDRHAATSAQPRAMLGQYQLLEKLGAGGMGTVYKALHMRLEKVVAVKVLPADRLQDPAAIARFDREMKAVGRLDHPHIVRAMDAGESEGVHYLVMEYVAGIDLSTLSRRLGPLPIADACELVRQAAIGLAHAHEHGLVHRDIKPSNLMLAVGSRLSAIGQKGRLSPADSRQPTADSPLLKILDLGLALLSDSPDASPQRELTSTGQMMGTLDYMAPEQGSDSHVVDIRADIYSLGATLYKLLTGEPIYADGKLQTPVQKVTALATRPAPPIQARRRDLPDALAAIVHRMIERDPARRFAAPSEVATALAPFAVGANLTALAERAALADGRRDTVADGSPPRSPGSTVVTTSVRSAPSAIVRRTAAHKPQAKPAWRVPAMIGVGIAIFVCAALAAVLLLQTPRGTVVVEVDPRYGNDVAIVVRGRGEEITLNDASGWELKLREGTYQVAVGASGDRFQLDKDAVTIRRGENEVVRVTLKPEPVAADLPAEMPPTVITRKPGSDAVAWLVKHNALGPESKLVSDAKEKISAYASRGVGFEYRIAGQLLASGKPTVLAVHGPKFFALELTDAQAEALDLVAAPVAAFRSGPEQIGRRAAQPEFRLTGLTLDHEETLGSDGQIRGWVEYERLRPGEPSTHYQLRVVTLVDEVLTVAQGIAGDLADDRGRIRLHIDSPLPRDWPRGGTSMFIEVGRFDAPDDFDQFVALSDPICRVVVLHQR